MTSINSYSLSLNPWEVLISVIKTNLRRYIKKGVFFRWIKKTLDDVAILLLNKFIQEFFPETIENSDESIHIKIKNWS